MYPNFDLHASNSLFLKKMGVDVDDWAIKYGKGVTSVTFELPKALDLPCLILEVMSMEPPFKILPTEFYNLYHDENGKVKMIEVKEGGKV